MSLTVKCALCGETGIDIEVLDAHRCKPKPTTSADNPFGSDSESSEGNNPFGSDSSSGSPAYGSRKKSTNSNPFGDDSEGDNPFGDDSEGDNPFDDASDSDDSFSPAAPRYGGSAARGSKQNVKRSKTKKTKPKQAKTKQTKAKGHGSASNSRKPKAGAKVRRNNQTRDDRDELFGSNPTRQQLSQMRKQVEDFDDVDLERFDQDAQYRKKMLDERIDHDATKRTLRIAAQINMVADETTDSLKAQGKRIDKVHADMADIEDDVHEANRKIDNLGHFFTSVKHKYVKNKKDKRHKKAKDFRENMAENPELKGKKAKKGKKSKKSKKEKAAVKGIKGSSEWLSDDEDTDYTDGPTKYEEVNKWDRQVNKDLNTLEAMLDGIGEKAASLNKETRRQNGMLENTKVRAGNVDEGLRRGRRKATKIIHEGS